MRRVQRLLLSAGLAGLATAGFLLVVGASADALVVLLFVGFWIGLHAFLGFVRLSPAGSCRGSEAVVIH